MSKTSRAPHSQHQEAAFIRMTREWPENATVRAFEVFLLRMACSLGSPMVSVDNPAPGNGIMVAYDGAGRQFKIEISQVGGPQ